MEFFDFNANWIYHILPLDPFRDVVDTLTTGNIAKYMPWVNWFIPVPILLNILYAWVSCIATYYIYTVVLRWLKVIE